MPGELEAEAVGLRVVLAPAGQAARHLDDVVLAVPAVHAQGVQLHDLAPVVLVDRVHLVAKTWQNSSPH